jgi:hypothetical protein
MATNSVTVVEFRRRRSRCQSAHEGVIVVTMKSRKRMSHWVGVPSANATVGTVTRDEAIRAGIFSLARWHRSDHGDRCLCIEAEQFGAQSAAVVDALVAGGVGFDGNLGTYRGPLGPPRMDPEIT